MSTTKPLLVVLGATGNQGGSILTHFLSLPSSPYALRAITRTPTSAAALSLASRGIEIVPGDINDPASLTAAFAGASIIFSVTDFLHPMTSPLLRSQALASGYDSSTLGFYMRDHETTQNKNIIDAAANVPSLQRFIFSSLANSERLSGGKYRHVYYSDSKAAAEEYGRETYPELWGRTSVFYAGFFLENFLGGTGRGFCPVLDKERNVLIASNAEPVTSILFPWYSVIDDTGPLIAALILAEPGKKLLGFNEWLSLQDVYRLMAKSLGTGIEFVDTMPSFEMSVPEMKRAREEMMGFAIEFGYCGVKVDASIVMPADLGVEVKLKSVEEWVEAQDWEAVLPVE
ncbi:NmrA-like family protein [Mollisia scopiformis]|uniref:NmrA-like family protein n=1 Tax=Mollisia scopiformis TaxID=149040 RepID=A0A132BCF3_MOLSC|nr:NmrA-like family protein [Mollisia scopiformis]KUJ09943.1 NmrA-like family protein [Mollisia scopiformis]